VEREVDIRPAETIEVAGADGAKVQCFIVKPHGFDPARKYPLILNVHGGPQMQWADAFRGDWQVYPGAGFVVAFPNPHGSTGFGQAYTDAISGDWGGKVMEDIQRVTDALAALPYVDKDRMGLMGWSWGGYAVNWLAGHTDRFKALASMMGIFDLHSEYFGTEELWFPEWEMKGAPWNSSLYDTFNPARFVARWRTPMLVVTGELDYRIPYTEGLATFTALRRQGVPARLVVLPRSGHWPRWTDMALYYTAHLEWFHRWLGGDAPPWSSADLAAGRVFDKQGGTRSAP
jgi:dipeptidyl aminopeptidase/acylaminoacyl peptidase